MTTDLYEDDLEQLNSFLRGEISAVETDEQALSIVEHTTAEGVLRENRSTHTQRAAQLRGAIRQLGGTPAEGSGAWGTFA